MTQPLAASRLSETMVNIVQGQFHIDNRANVRITTVLGSCIAACLYDPIARLGGMNHFMLPEDRRGLSTPSGCDSRLRYGTHAMEELINSLMREGARRDRIKAKVFGGGAVMAGLSDVGSQNIAFVRLFLAEEGFPIISQDVGGTAARRVVFAPATGQAWVKRVDSSTADTVGREEMQQRRRPVAPQKQPEPEVELF